MDLEDLGYGKEFEDYGKVYNAEGLVIARVLAEHKERYVVRTEKLELEAEITGNLRFTATERADFPAVGDWVAVSVFEDQLALIHRILPRKSILQRKAVGKFGEKQIIATNIDCVFIVMAVDRDFNPNRLERYLTLAHSGHVEPLVLLSKTDLITEEELQDMVDTLWRKHENLRIIPFSNHLAKGYGAIEAEIKKGRTYCVMGSSGVGKSTLINHLAGKDIMKTGMISESTEKGRHVTSHRELMVLEKGGILIDTPGMREVGILEDIEKTFDDISALSDECRFGDCTHTHEQGCAVLAALEDERIDPASYENYIKMQRESERLQATIAEKRKKEKDMGKMHKEYAKYKRRNS